MDKGPRFVEPLKLVERLARLQGLAPLVRMQRLATSLSETDGVAEYELQFAPNEAGKPAITGTVSAELILQCQRCLGPMPWPVVSHVHLAILPEGADLTDEDEVWDPLYVGQEPISIATLVEDELILSLPISPLHEPDTCGVKISDGEPATQGKPNPFSILAALKTPKG